jgi:hypothetical protein
MRLSIEIPDDTHRELKTKAANQGVTISEVVRLAVTQYLRGNFTLGFKEPGVQVHPDPVITGPPLPPAKGHRVGLSKADQAKGRSRK